MRDKEITSYIQNLEIMTSEETVSYILLHKCSCSRFGDGEFLVMNDGGNPFQPPNTNLKERLKEVIASRNPNLLICVPRTLTDIQPYTLNSQLSALGYRNLFMKSVVMKFVPTTQRYGDSLFTRFYMSKKDKKHIHEYVKLLQKIWENQDLLIVEGKFSRLGVGNDLFNNARSIKRIICPSKNAFDRYDEILRQAKEAAAGHLVILALGMTATVLAYDLAYEGIQALDLGHVDVEYEWFRIKAKHKVAILGKHVNEVAGGAENSSSVDREYLTQIVSEIS